MDTKERARIATAAATRARRMTKWRRWADEMRENGFIVLDPSTGTPRPTECGCPVTCERARVERHTSACGIKKAAERLSAYLDSEEPDEPMEPGGLFGDGMK